MPKKHVVIDGFYDIHSAEFEALVGEAAESIVLWKTVASAETTKLLALDVVRFRDLRRMSRIGRCIQVIFRGCWTKSTTS